MTSKWINAQGASQQDGLTGFNHPEYEKYRKKELEQYEYISNPPDVEEGVIECIRCGSYKVYSVSVQTRSADEPMSTRAHCVNCRKQWTQNC